MRCAPASSSRAEVTTDPLPRRTIRTSGSYPATVHGGPDRLPAMTEFGPAVWPPSTPIRTERLVLREAETRDHAVIIELLASAQVHTYLGGPRARDELERELFETPEKDLGICVVQLGGAMIGQVILRRAAGERGAGRAELGYLFLPEAWGFGYAAEACEAALDWLDNALPGEPVVLFTQGER